MVLSTKDQIQQHNQKIIGTSELTLRSTQDNSKVTKSLNCQGKIFRNLIWFELVYKYISNSGYNFRACKVINYKNQPRKNKYNLQNAIN